MWVWEDLGVVSEYDQNTVCWISMKYIKRVIMFFDSQMQASLYYKKFSGILSLKQTFLNMSLSCSVWSFVTSLFNTFNQMQGLRDLSMRPTLEQWTHRKCSWIRVRHAGCPWMSRSVMDSRNSCLSSKLLLQTNLCGFY